MTDPHDFRGPEKELALARAGARMGGLALDAVSGCPICAMGILLHGALQIAEAANETDDLQTMINVLTLRLHKGAPQ